MGRILTTREKISGSYSCEAIRVIASTSYSGIRTVRIET